VGRCFVSQIQYSNRSRYYYANWVPVGKSPVVKQTVIGAVCSASAITLVLTAFAFILFAYFKENHSFSSTSEQTDIFEFDSGYSSQIRFYTGDSNPANCRGNIIVKGFAGKTITSWTYDNYTCMANWTCFNRCNREGIEHLISFVLNSTGASAYAFDFSMSSPYLYNGTFALKDGRRVAVDTDQVFRGQTASKIIMLGTNTAYETLSTYQFPLATRHTERGMALQFVSYAPGSTVTQEDYSIEKDVVQVDVQLTINPLTTRIQKVFLYLIY
jgi:hypothetical protein